MAKPTQNYLVLALPSEQPLSDAEVTKILANLADCGAAVVSNTPDVRLVRSGEPFRAYHHVHVSTPDRMCNGCVAQAQDMVR